MILYRDRFIGKEEVHISMDDRGYVFGDGIYEVFRIYGGKLFEKEAHLSRLSASARAARIPLPYSVPQLAEKLEKLIVLSLITEGTLYLQITRGVAPRAHAFPADAEPVLLAYCNEVKRPHAAMQNGIAAVALPDERWLRCDIKSLNLLGNVLAKQEALDRGAGEAILHRGGTVTECSASNVMLVKNGEIRTHPADRLILHGVTRAFTLGLARKLNIPCSEQAFTLAELSDADEAFITGTTVEITPIVSVDGVAVGKGAPGPITRLLQDAFDKEIGLL